MESRRARTYSGEERRAALVRAREVGLARAAKELGIPKGTLGFWAYRERQRGGAERAESGGEDSRPGGDSADGGETARGGSGAVSAPATTAGVTEAGAGAVRTPESDAAPEGPARPPSPAAPDRRSRRSRVAKVYTPSQVAEALELMASIGIRPAARKLGIARTTLKEWERKAARAARGEGPAPTSGPDPQSIEAKRDAAILGEWSKQRGLGPSQVRNQLRRAGITVSVQTVRRVMEEAGYRPPKVERREHTGRYEAARPNQLWHMDFLHRYIHRQKVFVLAFLDDFSRYVTGWALDDAERADAVILAFEAAVARHGRPEAVMHDGGSAFWAWKGASRFTRLLEEYGVDQIKADTPQLNGKSEVFNANIQKELLDQVVFADVGELRRRLGPHFHWYNHQRTHHALGGLLVPADRFHGRVDEVMARIEAGGVGVADALDLAARSLDLFRVTSRNGKPEVWLMGRKILDFKE